MQERLKTVGSHPTSIRHVEEELILDTKFQECRLSPAETAFMLGPAILVSSKPTMPSLDLEIHSLIVFCFLGLLSPHIFQHPILNIKIFTKDTQST
jgi:hypothetical protein